MTLRGLAPLPECRVAPGDSQREIYAGLTSPHWKHESPERVPCLQPGGSNETAGLCLDDVDLDNGSVLVMGKGRRERWMPIGDTAAEGDHLSTPEESRHSFASFWTRWLAVSMP